MRRSEGRREAAHRLPPPAARQSSAAGASPVARSHLYARRLPSGDHLGAFATELVAGHLSLVAGQQVLNPEPPGGRTNIVLRIGNPMSIRRKRRGHDRRRRCGYWPTVARDPSRRRIKREQPHALRFGLRRERGVLSVTRERHARVVAAARGQPVQRSGFEALRVDGQSPQVRDVIELAFEYQRRTRGGPLALDNASGASADSNAVSLVTAGGPPARGTVNIPNPWLRVLPTIDTRRRLGARPGRRRDQVVVDEVSSTACGGEPSSATM